MKAKFRKLLKYASSPTRFLSVLPKWPVAPRKKCTWRKARFGRYLAIRLLVAWLPLGIQGCALFSGKVVELRSKPEKAVVSNVSGEKLGETPLILRGAVLDQFAPKGVLHVTMTSPGYNDVHVVGELHGEDLFEIALTPYNDTFFNERLTVDFSKQLNAIARELLNIQGLLVIHRTEEAEKAIAVFQKSFPNVAAPYVMLANIEEARGNREKAFGYLMRAKTIDPLDPVVIRMLNQHESQRK